VLFLMLSNHYPLAFATEYNWIIASLVFLMGVTIRHWFNTRHARKGSPTWTWLATVILFILIIWLSTVPKILTGEPEEQKISALRQGFISDPHFEKVRDTVLGRCAMCHARERGWAGIIVAPKGVILETVRELASHAREIYLQAGRSHAMPPANLTGVTDQERQLLASWYESAVSGAK